MGDGTKKEDEVIIEDETKPRAETEPEPKITEIAMDKDPEETKEKEEKEEDVDDLQVAWEHLEVARIAYEKKLEGFDPTKGGMDEEKLMEHNKHLKMLSHIMLRLGDANCYRDNFDAALQDYGKSESLRKFTDDGYFSRDLAEMYFFLIVFLTF